MNEVIETTDVCVDAYAFELREGDRVRLVFSEDEWGTVEKIQKPVASLREGDKIEAAIPPAIHVRLDSGGTAAFEGTFLRSAVWRWTVNELRR